MRFHRSESAFFVFITVVFTAGFVVWQAYRRNLVALQSGVPVALDGYLFTALVLLATAVLFGIFFIYPIIRSQVMEEGRLRGMTAILTERSETLQIAALTDPLTGMHNRRFFDDALCEYLKAFREVDKPIGLMIIDLDHFKRINDTHGHDVGDLVLREVAECLRATTRYHDVAARLGGEEFAIIVPNMKEGELVGFADRIRDAIAAVMLPVGKTKVRLTASVGVAEWDGKETPEQFYRKADHRLYEAKRAGRNRVCA